VARCQEKDFTISQFVDELQRIRGLKVDRRSVWEFLHAEGLTHKKTPPHRSKIAKTSSAGVNNGGSIRDASIPSA
jgi:transposase